MSHATASVDDSRSSLSVLIATMVLVGAPLVVLSQVAAAWRFDVVDDQMFGFYGWRIAHGATVYLDVWDNKPPGIYWINALGYLIGGDSYAGVIALTTTALALSLAFFFVIASSVYFRGAAALATILASFFIPHAYFQGGTNRTETFLVLFELAAVTCYMRGWARDRAWKWLLAGMLCGAAFLCKQVGLAAWGAMGLHTIVLVCTRDLPWKTGLRRCTLLLGGLAITLGAASAYLAAQGALVEAWRATFTFNAGYFAVGDSSLLDTWLNRYMLKQHMFPILLLPVLMGIAAAIHAVVWAVAPQNRPPEVESPLRRFGPACPRFMILFTVWTLVAFYGAAVSPGHYRHYLIPFIPPLMLMAGYLINVIKTEISLTRRVAQRAWVVAAFVAMGYFAIDAFVLQWGQAAQVWYDRWGHHVDPKYGYRLTAWELIASKIETLCTPDQEIHCWGYLPGVYLHAHRINVCRFTTTEKIGHVGDFADFVRQDLYEAFSTRPPAVFVVSVDDYIWFNGQSPNRPPPDWLGEWIAGWLDKSYARMDELKAGEEYVFIYKRRDLLTPDEKANALPIGPHDLPLSND